MKVSLPSFTALLALLIALAFQTEVFAFVVGPSFKVFLPTPSTNHEVCRQAITITRSDRHEFVTNEETDNGGHGDVDDEVDIDFLFEDPEIPYENLDVKEKVWRHAKKPLLRIGSKGATHSHGNSLRQLLDDHTVVKVKFNLKKFGTLQSAFECLRDLAVENGAPENIELIQMREADKIILFGLPGTLKKMEEGSFPPPPPIVVTSSNH